MSGAEIMRRPRGPYLPGDAPRLASPRLLQGIEGNTVSDDEIWECIGAESFGWFPYFPIIKCADCETDQLTSLRQHPDDKKLRCPECFAQKDKDIKDYRQLTRGMW